MSRQVRAWVALGSVLVLAQVVLPPGVTRDVAYLCLGAGAGFLTWLAVRRGAPWRRPARVLLLVAIVAWVLGDAAWALSGHISGGEAFPPATDAFYAAGYALFAAGLAAAVRARRSRLDRDAVIDGFILATVVTLVLHVAFLEPGWQKVGAVPIDRVTTIAYLVFDVVLVVQASYLARVQRPLGLGTLLIGSAFVLVFLGDVMQTVALRFPEYAMDPQLVDVWWAVAYVLLGAAALHGASEEEVPPEGDDEVRPISWRQIAAFGAALAVVPAVPGMQLALEVPVSTAPSIAAAGIVIVLVCLRLGVAAGRMRDQARRLALAARTDPLTGLATSAHFRDVLDARVRDDRPFLVALVALDRLTEITDTLGYGTGDDLLREAARRVRAEIGEGATAARLAGDAFAVLADDDGTDDALTWGARLRSVLTAPITLADVVVSVDAIVGVVAGPDEGADGGELRQRAEVAVSVARTRPDGVARYSGRMSAGELLAPHLMSELSRAITEGEIVVHYQPQVDVETGRVAGVEALVRWQHPVHGLLPPAAFVPAAERTGLIRPLTLYMLDRVLAQAVDWRAAGSCLRVAVNLSVRDLFDPTFAGRVADLLDRYGVPRHGLELELTESMALVDPARSIEVLRAIEALGVVLSVDDFGTGYSSLAHLQRLPVHRLKIDRSFVGRMLDEEASAAIVRATIELARNLGMTVVAEGVEDDPTLLALQGMGCDLAQGFGLGRPVPADEVVALVARIESRVPELLAGAVLP